MNEENKRKLVEYINSQKEKGIKDEDIKSVLLKAGWNEEDLSIVFKETGEDDVSQKSEEGPKSENTVSENEEVNSEPVKENINSNENISQSFNTETGGAEFDQNTNSEVKPPQDEVKGRFGKIIFIIAIIVIFLGGASVAAYYTWQELSGDEEILSDEEGTKEDIIVDTLVNHLKADSFSTETKMKFSVEDVLNGHFVSEGFIQKGDTFKDISMLMEFDLGFSVKEGIVVIQVDLEGESRLVDSVYYVNLDKAPTIPFVADFSFLEGEWIHADIEESIKDASEIDDFELEDIVSVINFEMIFDSIEEYGVDVLEIAKNENFIEINVLNEEEDEDKDENEDEAKEEDEDKDLELEFVVDIYNTPGFLRMISEEDFIPDDMKADIINMAEDMEDELSTNELDRGDFVIPLKIDIDENKGYFKKIYTEFDIDIDFETEDLSENKESITVEYLFSVVFDEFNESFDKLDRPKNSSSLEELMEENLDQNPFEEEFIFEDKIESDEEDIAKDDTQQEKETEGLLRHLLAGAGWLDIFDR